MKRAVVKGIIQVESRNRSRQSRLVLVLNAVRILVVEQRLADGGDDDGGVHFVVQQKGSSQRFFEVTEKYGIIAVRILTQKDNVALAVSLSGYLAAVAIIYVGAFLGPTRGWVRDLLGVGGWSMMGIGLLNISRYINDRWMLRKFSTKRYVRPQSTLRLSSLTPG